MNILEIHKLGKVYPQNHTVVLKDLDLTIRKGEKVAVIGPSGTGKSTFLSLVAGLDRPTQGQLNFLGRDLALLKQQELTQLRAEHIGIVFQQFHLMTHLTALENVLLPLMILNKPVEEQKAITLLKRVGLGERLGHFPSQLSGGECQRVAIARALIIEPDLLLADEPSGNLDAKTGAEVMNLLFDVIEENKSTLLLVTHNHELANKCDRVLTLKDGKFS